MDEREVGTEDERLAELLLAEVRYGSDPEMLELIRTGEAT